MVLNYIHQNALMILAAFGTSVVSGTVGIAGGILLLTFMAPFFPAVVLIPLHGSVQLASNLVRVCLTFREIEKRIIVPFILGALVGAIAGSRFVVQLPEREYKIILACFILFATWMPDFKGVRPMPGKFFWLGGLTSFLSLFIGAIGPLISPFFIREKLGREKLVVTKAACQATAHALKVAVFVYLGFRLDKYLPLFLGMLVAVVLGNWCGKSLLGKISERLFMNIFKATLSVLAIQMLVKAVS